MKPLTELGAEVVAAVAVCESERDTLHELLVEVLRRGEQHTFRGELVVFLPPDLESRIREALS